MTKIFCLSNNNNSKKKPSIIKFNTLSLWMQSAAPSFFFFPNGKGDGKEVERWARYREKGNGGHG